MSVKEIPKVTLWSMAFYNKDEMESQIDKEIQEITEGLRLGTIAWDPDSVYRPVKQKLYDMMESVYAIHPTRNKHKTRENKMKLLKFILPFEIAFVVIFLASMASFKTTYATIGIVIGLLPFFWGKLADRMFLHAVELDKKYFEGEVHRCWKQRISLK